MDVDELRIAINMSQNLTNRIENYKNKRYLEISA